MKRTLMTYMVAAIVSLAAIGAQVASTAAMAQEEPIQGTVACGQVVEGNVTLTANLNCTGDGLIVGDDDTTINLNGFGIYGPGQDSSKVGIMVSEDNVEVTGPGVISGFQASILATGSKELTVSLAIMEGNQIAGFFTGADFASVDSNIIRGNNIGIASHSASGINVGNNLMNENELAGVTFVNTDNSAINGNNIQGSQNAVFLDSQSTGNVIEFNNAHENLVDLNNANGLAPNINQNGFSDNNCEVSNPSGLCIGR